jgi:TPR repeat protein
MFVFRCAYEMAKLRKADYFVHLKEWTDEKGDSMYKIGFSSDPKVDPSLYFGDDIDHNKRLSFLSVKECDELWDPVEALKSQNKQESSAVIEALVKAAELGDAKSQFELATAYLQGLGIPRDVAEALKWCRKAAEQGYAEAQTGLGGKYQYGVGVSKDDAEAVKWYRKAAEQGHAEAQVSLGRMYYMTVGMQDGAETIKWYRRAAEQGYAEAQLFLGMFYDEGRVVKQDFIQAHMWFSLAATGYGARAFVATGFAVAAAERAQQQQAERYRDLVAEKMTRQQIVEAQRLAKEWKPKKE